GLLDRREVGCVRAGGVGGTHVGVVGRVGAQAGEQLADVGLLILGQRRVLLLLLADRRLGGRGLGGRAERAEPVGGEHLGGIGQLGGEPVCRGVLMAYEHVGVVGAQ